jgi:uncharacterized protein (DUF1800 family)
MVQLHKENPPRLPRFAPRRGEQLIEHLLRRAGFGATAAEVGFLNELGYVGAVDYLLDYEEAPDDVDDFIGKPGYALTSGGFIPRSNIAHARQRWLFRMIHTARPLQEKMALFWHNHFATAQSKIAGAFGSEEGTRYMAAKPSEDPAGVKGQLELFREHALGNFRTLLTAVAKDVAMVVWLDGRTNVRGRPQENFARELMELFTMGVDTFPENDVYEGARVFTGWNLSRVTANTPLPYWQFSYIANNHDTAAKDFSFPIYADGSRRIPARSAAAGMDDGIDLINAVARHPATGPRLARKLYQFFISETAPIDEQLVSDLARTYYASSFEMKPVIRQLLMSPQFQAGANRYARYAWPVEFVARSLKEVGWSGFPLNDALTPLANMGQQLFEPPDVNGWELGPGWFSSGSMLTRMNFAALLASNQRFNLRDATRGSATTLEALVSFLLDRVTAQPFDGDAARALIDYAHAGVSSWTGSDAQRLTKAAGLVHLIVGSGNYQFV